MLNKEYILNIISQWTNTAYIDSSPFILKKNNQVFIAWLQLSVVTLTDDEITVEIGTVMGFNGTEVVVISDKQNKIVSSRKTDNDFDSNLQEDEYYDKLITLFNGNNTDKNKMLELLIKAFPDSMLNVYSTIINKLWEA